MAYHSFFLFWVSWRCEEALQAALPETSQSPANPYFALKSAFRSQENSNPAVKSFLVRFQEINLLKRQPY